MRLSAFLAAALALLAIVIAFLLHLALVAPPVAVSPSALVQQLSSEQLDRILHSLRHTLLRPCKLLTANDFRFDPQSLGVDWNVPVESVSAQAPGIAKLMGCASSYHKLGVARQRAVSDAFRMGLYLTVKNATEEDAVIAFNMAAKVAKKSGIICSKASAPDSACSHVPYVSQSSDSPFMSFILTSTDPIIAVPLRDRIQRYLSTGDIESSPSIRAMSDVLNDFIDEHPAWKDEATSYVSVIRNPNLRRALIQKSENCFMVAPVVALHYAINFRASALDNRTIDITEYARKHLDTTTLLGLLLFNVGSNIMAFTKSIFAPALGEDVPEIKPFPILRPSHETQSDCMLLRSCLEQNAVGIMDYIETDERFKNASSASFHGKRAAFGASEGHAMVLIGVQCDAESGQYILMLQNSWSTLPVVEVRQDYAASRGASLIFVTTPQIDYRAVWPTVAFHSATAAVNAGALPLRSTL